MEFELRCQDFRDRLVPLIGTFEGYGTNIGSVNGACWVSWAKGSFHAEWPCVLDWPPPWLDVSLRSDRVHSRHSPWGLECKETYWSKVIGQFYKIGCYRWVQDLTPETLIEIKCMDQVRSGKCFKILNLLEFSTPGCSGCMVIEYTQNINKWLSNEKIIGWWWSMGMWNKVDQVWSHWMAKHTHMRQLSSAQTNQSKFDVNTLILMLLLTC